MRQASGLSSVLVMNCMKSVDLVFDARVASCLGGLDRVVGGHVADLAVVGWLWQVELTLIGK